MNTKGCVAMILAGGKGTRLGSLTHCYSKPAVYFGGNQRIIDFTMNNCKRSGIKTIGILSQCSPTDLYDYISSSYNNKPQNGGVYMLPPKNNESSYNGTADAVYKNIDFIDRFKPEYVLILAGDHIYSMDYKKILAFHKKTDADVTVASTPVSIVEASRFGILSADENGRIYDFEEKPVNPKSNLASMGIYVFKWSVLKKYLLADNRSKYSLHDFGRNILPKMLYAGELMYTYKFDGYWRDVGTVESLWEANMDLLDNTNGFQLPNEILEENIYMNGILDETVINQSIIPHNCTILGEVEHSVLGASVTVGKDSEIIDSVIMPGVDIGDNVKIHNAVIGMGVKIMNNVAIGEDTGSDLFIDNRLCSEGISLIAPWIYISKGMRFQKNSHIYKQYRSELNGSIYVAKSQGKDRYLAYHESYA